MQRQWKGILKEMLEEQNQTKLQRLASDLEEAIFERQIALEGKTGGDIQERLELITATEQLYEVRVKRLGFPDWREKRFESPE
jgi:hypothetical protein